MAYYMGIFYFCIIKAEPEATLLLLIGPSNLLAGLKFQTDEPF